VRQQAHGSSISASGPGRPPAPASAGPSSGGSPRRRASERRFGQRPQSGEAAVEGLDAALQVGHQQAVGGGFQRRAQLGQQRVAFALGAVLGAAVAQQHQVAADAGRPAPRLPIGTTGGAPTRLGRRGAAIRCCWPVRRARRYARRPEGQVFQRGQQPVGRRPINAAGSTPIQPGACGTVGVQHAGIGRVRPARPDRPSCRPARRVRWPGR
jgi:hypothetical protein